MNPLIDQGMAMFTALAALKVKGARLVQVPDGIEIHMRGKPTLLLTHDHAREFANQVSEAEHDT